MHVFEDIPEYRYLPLHDLICKLTLMIKVKVSHYMPSRHTGIALTIFDPNARRGWVVRATPQPLYSLERDPVPTVQEAGWASGPVWISSENLAFIEFRTLDRPARS
jgi:hypothetical protein